MGITLPIARAASAQEGTIRNSSRSVCSLSFSILFPKDNPRPLEKPIDSLQVRLSLLKQTSALRANLSPVIRMTFFTFFINCIAPKSNKIRAGTTKISVNKHAMHIIHNIDSTNHQQHPYSSSMQFDSPKLTVVLDDEHRIILECPRL